MIGARSASRSDDWSPHFIVKMFGLSWDACMTRCWARDREGGGGGEKAGGGGGVARA